jgi:hypothetical protein
VRDRRHGAGGVSDGRRAVEGRGEVVELEIDLLAFEQIDGEPNRNGLRFKSSSLSAMARGGVGQPFIADHDQRNIAKRAGTIVKSKLEKIDPKHQRIMQTAKVTAAWAVEGVLTGTIDRFSIGWRATGPVNCTACKTEIFEDCYHWPLDVLDDGTVVEWEYTSAQLVETSAVTVPAVPATQIGEIRAALASEGRAIPAPEERKRMSKKVTEMLGLAATAGDEEVLTAVKQLQERAIKAEAKTQLKSESYDELKAQYESVQGQLSAIASQLSQQGKREFLTEARLAKGVVPESRDEARLARMYDTDPEWAREELAAMPRVTPVGVARQSDAPDDVLGGSKGKVESVLSEHGYDANIVRAQLKSLGVKNVEEVLARRIGSEG